MSVLKQAYPFIRELPKGWTIKRFQELLFEPLRNGIYKKKEFHGRGQKIINMDELFDYDFICNQEMRRVELNQKEMEKNLVKDGDLLFARRSLILEGSEKCLIIVNPSENTTFESSIIRARLNRDEADPKFYYYLFHSPLGRALVASIATQTAVSGITGSNLVLLKVPYPPLPIQHKIAVILSNYERLIENNTRRIKILEEMARLLYRQWFVNFRFPGYEHIKLVDSKLGLIPEGWKIKYLPEVCSKVIDGTHDSPKPVDKGYCMVTGKHIVDGFIDFSKCYFISPEEHEKVMKRSRAEKGDIIFSNIGTLGSSVLVDQVLNLALRMLLYLSL